MGQNEKQQHDKQELMSARIKRSIRRYKNSTIIAIILAAGGIIAFGGQVAGGVKSVYEVVFPKADALDLAREDDKAKISREFVAEMWKRLYRSRNFIARIQRRASDAEITGAWVELLKSIEETSTRMMIYAASFSEYYGEERRHEYEDGIQLDFNAITKVITDFRYSAAVRKLEFPLRYTSPVTVEENAQINSAADEIMKSLDRLHIRLYQFIGCFDKKHQTENACKYSSGGAGGSW